MTNREAKLRLADLEPRISPPGRAPFQSLYFLCPNCRMHEIGIEIWGGKSGFHYVGQKDSKSNPVNTKLWHAEQGPYKDWDTLSITPSIDAGGHSGHKCAGWHGFITNGEVTP